MWMVDVAGQVRVVRDQRRARLRLRRLVSVGVRMHLNLLDLSRMGENRFTINSCTLAEKSESFEVKVIFRQ